MEIGAAIFFTEYSMEPTALVVALEERGFDSLWVAEHSHIPVTRRFGLPGGMELTKQYYDVMDPVRHAECRSCRHHAPQARDRRLSGDPARHYSDRQTCRLPRPGVERAVFVWHRRGSNVVESGITRIEFTEVRRNATLLEDRASPPAPFSMPAGLSA